MKLPTEFIKLPLRFDVDRLREEIAQFSEEEWMAHTTGYAGNMSIPLISLYGEFNDAMHGPMMLTSALNRCEYIQQIMTSFGEVFGRSRLMRLESGHDVPPHIDINYHWYNRVRIHIPITTTEDVLFHCNDRHVHMAAGECWIFNSWMEHTVKNSSDKTRVHLVLDTAGSVRFWELVSRGEQPFGINQGVTAEAELLEYEIGRQTNIRTETYNVPLVLSAGELEKLIGDLANDIECTNDAESKGAALFAEHTRNFIRAWREVWSEHAMMPSGWPLYHDLVRQVHHAVTAITPELVLASNGGDLVQAFQSLVLSSAVNEEFAPQYIDKDYVPENLQKVVRSFTSKPPTSNGSGEMTQPASRNAPCPCGSGERYKHCHGRV